MYKRISLVVVAIFCCNALLSVLSSCNRKKNDTIKTTRCNLTSCFAYTATDVRMFNSATNAPLQAPAYTVKATDLTLQIVLEGNTHICYKKAPVKWYERMSSMSMADAYTPLEQCLIKQGGDSIISYNIYSDKDYDQAHPAGTSLNDIITTEDIPSKALMGQYDMNNIMVLDLMVDKAPEQSGQSHKFTIVLTQQDGETINITTEPINLLL